jgi:hypothetical protein
VTDVGGGISTPGHGKQNNKTKYTSVVPIYEMCTKYAEQANMLQLCRVCTKYHDADNMGAKHDFPIFSSFFSPSFLV